MKYLKYIQICEKYDVSYSTARRIVGEIEREVIKSDSKLPKTSVAYIAGKTVREDVIDYYMASRTQFKDDTRRKSIPNLI